MLEFNPTTGAPTVGLQFDDEGSKKFEEITKNNSLSQERMPG
jgi:preprotein translocase subunit SecD